VDESFFGKILKRANLHPDSEPKYAPDVASQKIQVLCPIPAGKPTIRRWRQEKVHLFSKTMGSMDNNSKIL
jgi:hypothetical protein